MNDRTMLPPISHHMGYLLRRAQLIVFQDFQDATADFGLTPAEYSTLSILREHGRLRPNRLTEILAIKPSNCVIMINKLEERGILRREKLAVSGRAVALSLTDAGQMLLDQMNEKVAIHLSKMEGRLGAGEAKALIELLIRFIG